MGFFFFCLEEILRSSLERISEAEETPDGVLEDAVEDILAEAPEEALKKETPKEILGAILSMELLQEALDEAQVEVPEKIPHNCDKEAPEEVPQEEALDQALVGEALEGALLGGEVPQEDIPEEALEDIPEEALEDASQEALEDLDLELVKPLEPPKAENFQRVLEATLARVPFLWRPSWKPVNASEEMCKVLSVCVEHLYIFFGRKFLRTKILPGNCPSRSSVMTNFFPLFMLCEEDQKKKKNHWPMSFGNVGHVHPTNICIVSGTFSVATIVVVSAGVDI